MYFIFPLHLTSASTLPGETVNPKIVLFHLNDACFLANTHKTHKKYHLVLNHPSM